MNCKKTIKQRKSAFAFTDDEIKYSEILDILDSARLAPSAKNRQPWKFYILEKEEKEKVLTWFLEELKQNNSEETGLATAKYIKDSQYLVLVFMEDTTDNIATNILSIGASIENALLTATEKGIGSLWIFDLCVISHKLTTYCNAPGKLISSVCFGIDKDPSKRVAKKKTLNEIILNLKN